MHEIIRGSAKSFLEFQGRKASLEHEGGAAGDKGDTAGHRTPVKKKTSSKIFGNF